MVEVLPGDSIWPLRPYDGLSLHYWQAEIIQQE